MVAIQPRLRLFVQILRRVQRIFQQTGSGHRANPAGYWRNPAGTLGCYVEFDIANQLAIGLPVDSNIDDTEMGEILE